LKGRFAGEGKKWVTNKQGVFYIYTDLMYIDKWEVVQGDNKVWDVFNRDKS
jgi:hypothetical protein